MKQSQAAGHISALFTIAVWGTTFISTKVLLEAFQPVEILFLRFFLGLAALTAAVPRRLKGTTRRQELTFAAAGLCGVCLYYLLENIALTYTLASNVGVIITTVPFFTALLSCLFLKESRPGGGFLLGFIVALTGVCLISLNGARLELNPLGDLLTLAAALAWAGYSILTRIISGYGYSTILTTRRVFGYGLLWMLPALLVFDCRLGLERFQDPVYAANFLFLGLGASAVCFVTWNFAVGRLGAVKTSAYTYLTPVVTVAASVWILREPFTPMEGLGIALTLAGLLLSERKTNKGDK